MRKKEDDAIRYKKKMEELKKREKRLEREAEENFKQKNSHLLETQGEKDLKEYGRVFKERIAEQELMVQDQKIIDAIQADIDRLGKTKELKKELKQAKMVWAKKRNSVEFFDERMKQLSENLTEASIEKIQTTTLDQLNAEASTKDTAAKSQTGGASASQAGEL